MQVAEGGDGLGADERDVAGEDERDAWGGARRRVAKWALSICMAWPVPRCSACRTNLTPVGATAARTRSALVADDAEDAVGGDEGLGGGDDVEQEGAAADLVEDLGALALEPRALARGHDGDCESGCFHCASFSLSFPIFFYLRISALAGVWIRDFGYTPSPP